jgi:hypothetical protein
MSAVFATRLTVELKELATLQVLVIAKTTTSELDVNTVLAT